MRRIALLLASCALALLAACGAGASAPEVTLSPESLDFGRLTAGCATSERELCLQNAGTADAVLESVSLVGDPSFFFTSAPPTPATIPAGGKTCVTVAYRPRAEGDASATLRFTVEGLAAPLEASLEGHGDPMATQTDTFVLLGVQQKDLLLVVDDTEATDDLALEANLRALARYLSGEGDDLRVAVTTTAATDNGALLPLDGTRPGIRSAAAPGFAEDLVADVEGRPRRDDTPDRGLEAALRALRANPGLLRPDASLGVVVVSPTDDASTRPVEDYIGGLLAIKGAHHANLFSLASIGGGSEGCTTVNGTEVAPAPRYADVAKQTGGVRESACTTDWSRALENLSLAGYGYGYQMRFFLTEVPVASTLVVTVETPRWVTYEATGWWYDATQNVIELDPFAVPEPGSTIHVTYEVACP